MRHTDLILPRSRKGWGATPPLAPLPPLRYGWLIATLALAIFAIGVIVGKLS